MPEPSLLAAARTATEKLAAAAPDELRAWVARNERVDLAPVQRLIAHSFTLKPGDFADDALAFISADNRRMNLGSSEDQAGTTARLIAAVSDHWSEAQVRGFEAMVWNFKPAHPPHLLEAGDKRIWQNILRRLRLRLLRALPDRRASEQTRRRLNEEQRAFPDTRLGVARSGARFIGSIMSVADIGRASDDDVINAFKQLPDSTGWNHPKDWDKGGNIQLAREFANFAKTAPDRALRLVERFAPEFGSRAAGLTLEALGDTADPTKLMQTIVDLAARGFQGVEFRNSAAMTIDRLLKRDVEVDQRIVDLLLHWLTTPELSDTKVSETLEDSEAAPTNHDDAKPEEEDSNIRSLLWGYGAVSFVPGGAYPVMQTLVSIYLRRSDTLALTEALTCALEHVADRNVWQHLLFSLINFRPKDKGNAVDEIQLLERVLDRFPELLGTEELALLLAHIHWWAPDFVESELTKWNRVRNRMARRGYGELVALIALLHPERSWSKAALDAIEQSPEDRDARAGAATTAVNLWSEPKYRGAATELVLRLLPRASGRGEWAAVP